MTLAGRPSWESYKRALARLAEAGTRLDTAQAEGAPNLAEAEREFEDALRAYDAARDRLAGGTA